MRKGIAITLAVVFLAIAVFAGANHKTKQQELASCQLESYRAYAHQIEPKGTATSLYTKTCMEAKGYIFNSSDKGCPQLQATTPSGEDITSAVLQIDERCYDLPKTAGFQAFR